MKRYTTFLDCAEQHDNGRFYIAREVSALLAAVAEEVRKLPKRYAYLTFSEWQESHDEAIKRVLALLEQKS